VAVLRAADLELSKILDELDALSAGNLTTTVVPREIKNDMAAGPAAMQGLISTT
jgi:hypothetical protein